MLDVFVTSGLNFSDSTIEEHVEGLDQLCNKPKLIGNVINDIIFKTFGIFDFLQY